jgi:hypothetical protein
MRVHSSFEIRACQRFDSVYITLGLSNAIFLCMTIHISELLKSTSSLKCKQNILKSKVLEKILIRLNTGNKMTIQMIEIFFRPVAQEPVVGKGLLIIKALRTHSDTPHSVGLLWTSDQPDARNSTWQQATLTWDGHPCARRDSNPQSQKANGRRPTP